MVKTMGLASEAATARIAKMEYRSTVMRLRTAIAIFGILASASPGWAAGLCKCCGGETVESCQKACTPVAPSEGQCIAAVDYDAKPDIAPGVNPLYGMSWRNIWLGTPGRSEREAFRRLLESARKGAERDRKAALRDHSRGIIDDEQAQQFAKRYEDAIVNYYLGLHAYRATASK